MCESGVAIILYILYKICKVLTKQNYFQYKDLQDLQIQEGGLAMGAPTSSSLPEIHLQYLENTKIFDILVKLHIMGYCRYVDDILLVYQNSATNIHEVLSIGCNFDRASSSMCGNKMPTRCNRGFYCTSYCSLNMFRAPLCPSSGAQEYYTVVAACGISCCGFQVAGLVWS